jgi:hypothetical protein
MMCLCYLQVHGLYETELLAPNVQGLSVLCTRLKLYEIDLFM